MTDTNPQRLPIRWILFWGLVLIGAFGLFLSVRAFTVCWRLTALPGIPSASCADEAVNVLETPVIVNVQNTPESTATPDLSVPEDTEYPAWDGGSRINILFVGLRGGEPTEADRQLDVWRETGSVFEVARDVAARTCAFAEGG